MTIPTCKVCLETTDRGSEEPALDASVRKLWNLCCLPELSAEALGCLINSQMGRESLTSGSIPISRGAEDSLNMASVGVPLVLGHLCICASHLCPIGSQGTWW